MGSNSKIYKSEEFTLIMEYELLEKIGLTRNESLVYLALLRLGTSKTGEIIKQSEINSGRIYETFETLKNKGLISESIVNNVKHFTASPPEKIMDYLKQKNEELKKEESLIKSAIPELDKIRNLKLEKSQALVYTGFEGIKTAAYEALNATKKGEEILAMGVTEMKDKRFNEFWVKYALDRAKGKHLTKFLFSERSAYFKNTKNMPLVVAKVLEGITPTTIDIFGDDKVLILNYNEPVSCILIYDKNTTTSFKNFFYQLWKLAKP